MASLQATIVDKAVKTIAKDTVKRHVHAKVSNSSGDTQNSAKDAAAKFAGALFDIAWDAAKNGNVSRETLVKAVVQESVVLAGLSSNQKAQCFGALLDAGYYGTELSAGFALVVSEEFVSAGVATPLVMAQAAMLTKTSLDLVNASIKANQLCGPVAVEGYYAIKAEWGTLGQRGEAAFNQVARELTYGISSLYGVGGM